MLVGPTNCAKSFMLMPLRLIYDCFMSPSNNAFNFVTDLDKEIIFFNDLRYLPNGEGDKKFMPWDQFLNLLEDAPINVAMPKNFYSEDKEWSKLQPIFSTSDQSIVRFIQGIVDLGETKQMDARWEVIVFHYQWKKNRNRSYYLSVCKVFCKIYFGI